MKIDLSEIIKQKSPALFRIIPGFILTKIKRIVREKDLNIILKKIEKKQDLEFIKGGLDALSVSSENIGFNNLPKNGNVIVVSNHPLGGLDGVAMIRELGKRRKDIKIKG